MHIKVSTTLKWPISRQLPTYSPHTFSINKKVSSCDAWFVYQGLSRPESTICPKNRTFFITYEPPDLHTYNEKFLSQFEHLITCHKHLQHPHLILAQQSQPWLIGVTRGPTNDNHYSRRYAHDFASLERLSYPPKTKLLSIITSSKSLSPGHKKRLHIIENLRRSLPGQVDVYGYGFTPIVDKLDALIPYKYHLVLENSMLDDYWTEKVSDSFLGWSLPIIYGCPNLNRYFPAASFIQHSASSPSLLVQALSQLSLVPRLEPSQLASMTVARNLVLNCYNIFAQFSNYARSVPPQQPSLVSLLDERLFRPHRALRSAIRLLTDPYRRNIQ